MANHPFDVADLMSAAEQKEGRNDWADPTFLEPLGVLADAYAAADLNDVGGHILRSGLVHGLRMRLRAQEWIRSHPEITRERILASIVVVGMMRSGTTLLAASAGCRRTRPLRVWVGGGGGRAETGPSVVRM